ncbi:kelch-like protein 5 isoform X2 [Eurosta solidaginis]|uniref:kelch-like protein 5 isoform X2 n=1 Tax=Eurosta solidaginis TaxID=178769 RepID=UPI003530CD99
MAMALCNPTITTPTRQRLSEMNPDGVKYFMEKLLFQIYQHFDDQELIDVSFKLSSPAALVTAHRLILSAASPYFRELFESDKGICPLIEINDIDSETFERLITFCYTGKTIATIDNVDRMLKTALLFKLEDAVISCVDFLIDHITDYTLERVYSLQNETQCTILNERILEYEIMNFNTIIESAEYLNFDASKLQTILESDDLNVPTEKVVFDAVKLWYEHDAATRQQYLPDIIACLRLTYFDTNYLLENIQPLPGCEFIVLKALSWANIPLTRATNTLRFTNPRTRWSKEPLFLALNLSSPAGNSKNIVQYNQSQDSWQMLIELEIDVQDFRAIIMDESLYFIGGKRNDETLNEVRSWNLKTKALEQLPSMNQPRYRHSVAVLNGNIYAIGGEDDLGPLASCYKILSSVEMYSASNGWKFISNMTVPRSGASAVTLNGKIYVMGGRAGFINPLKSVERYDPTTNCWTKCADMIESHNYPCNLHHSIHVLHAYRRIDSRSLSWDHSIQHIITNSISTAAHNINYSIENNCAEERARCDHLYTFHENEMIY